MSFGLHLGLTLGGTVVAGGGAPATPAVITINSIGPQASSGNVPVDYTIDKNDSGVQVLLALAGTAQPGAALFGADSGTDPSDGAGSGYLDAGTVAMTIGGSAINGAIPDGLVSASYQLWYLPTGGGDSDVVGSGAVTIDTTAPAYDSSVPADDATDIAVDSTIAITFDENVVAGSGTFTLYDVTGAAAEETFTVGGSGDNGGTIGIATDTVTLTPGVDMTASNSYSVRWTAGAVTDAFSNPVAANAGDTLLNFTTAAAAAGPAVNGTPTNVYSTTSTGISGGTGSSITAAAGSDRLILAMFTYQSGSTGPSSLTLSMGAQAFTLAGVLGSTTGSIAKAHFFYIKEADIPTGSQAISWTSDQPIATPVITLLELTDVDQSTTIGGVGAAEATLSSASTTSVSRTTTATNSMVVSLFCVTITQDQTFTTGTDSGGSVTQITEFDLGLAFGQATACYEVISGSGVAVSHTASWTPDTSRWGKRSIEILAA